MTIPRKAGAGLQVDPTDSSKWKADFAAIAAQVLSGTTVPVAGALSVTVDDGVTNAVTDVATLAHTTTGTAAAGIGTGLKLRAENGAGATVDAARIAAVLTTVTAGAEDSALTFQTRAAGAALVEAARFAPSGALLMGGLTADPGAGNIALPNSKFLVGKTNSTPYLTLAYVDGSNVIQLGATNSSGTNLGTGTILTFAVTGSEIARFSASGGLSLGITADPGAFNIGLPNSKALYGRNAGGTQYSALAQVDASSNTLFGNTGANSIHQTVTSITWQNASAYFAQFTGTTGVFGVNAIGTGAPSPYKITAPVSIGTNIGSSNFTLAAGLGTGTGALGYVSLQGTIGTTSGTGQHTAGESFRAYGQYCQVMAGEVYTRTAAKTASYTALITDNYIPCDTAGAAAGFPINLPAANAVPAGWVITVKDSTGSAATKNVTITRAGADTIEGATTKVINTAFGLFTLMSDGTSKWEVVGKV